MADGLAQLGANALLIARLQSLDGLIAMLFFDGLPVGGLLEEPARDQA